MTNKKSTRRAMLSSAIAVIMCVAMLIGTTFAWFTDTASTAVNKIQSGTLDVQLIDEDGNDLEGKTLDFKKAADAPADEAILWEPGCTYELPAIKIVNNGNLALKYKVQITGLDGDSKLLEAIEWTIDGVDMNEEYHLAANETSGALTITGHMKDDAGNEYQGLSIDGIAITVIATQDTVEYDSNNNTYDEKATYPVASASELATAFENAQDGDVVVLSQPIEISSGDYNVSNRLTVDADDVTIDLNGNSLTVSNHTLTLTGDNITVKNGSIVATTTNTSQTYGSYGLAVSGKNVVIDGVTLLGGISVTGYNAADDKQIYDGVCATITNCNITATNYYAVCAQGTASALVKNCVLTNETGVAFFWIEKDAGSLTYEASTVTMNGSKPLYNAGGNAPIAQ